MKDDDDSSSSSSEGEHRFDTLAEPSGGSSTSSTTNTTTDQPKYVFGSGFDDLDNSEDDDDFEDDYAFDSQSRLYSSTRRSLLDVPSDQYVPRWAKLLFTKPGVGPHTKRMIKRSFTAIRETILTDVDTSQPADNSVVLSPTRFLAVLITCINEISAFSELHPFLLLLEAVSTHVPADVWRAESNRICGFLTKLLRLHSETIALPAILTIIAAFLKFQTIAQWASPAVLRLYQLVLALAVDQTQKESKEHERTQRD